MISRRRLLLAGALFLLAGCGPQAPAFHATDLTGKNIGGDFNLTDARGQLQKLANFRGKVVILFFGYTSCPDICPSALAKFANLLQLPDLSAEQLQVIFISLDPERDTPQRLAEYVPWFHPSFIGLTGDASTIAGLARQFRVTSLKKEIPGGMGYVLDHSAGAYVFGKDGRLRLYLGENAKIDDIASDLRRLLSE